MESTPQQEGPGPGQGVPGPGGAATPADLLTAAAGALAGVEASAPARAVLAEILQAVLAAFTRTRAVRDPLPDTAPGSAAEALAVLAGIEQLRSSLSGLDAVWQVAAEQRIRSSDAREGIPTGAQGRGAAAEIALARRISPAASSFSLASARRLVQHMPGTVSALRDGAVTARQASTVAGALSTASPETCARIDELISQDPHTLDGRGCKRLRSDIEQAVQRLEPGASRERAERAARRRHLTMTPLADGMARVTAILRGIDAVGMLQQLRSEAESLRAAGERTSVPALEADLLVDAVRTRASARDASGTSSGTAATPPRPRTTPGLEVGIIITDTALLGPEDDSQSARLPGYGTLPAHIVRDTLLGRPPGHLDDGEADPPDEQVTAFYRRLYTNPRTGELIAMDSRARAFPAGLARMLRVRDTTCRTTWCNARIRHSDHVVPHHRGGPTSYANGQGLCARCNLVKEHGPFHLTPDPAPPAEAGEPPPAWHWAGPHGAQGTSRTPPLITPTSDGGGRDHQDPPSTEGRAPHPHSRAGLERRDVRAAPRHAYPVPMPGLLTLDLGTTSVKAAMLDLRGRTLAAASEACPVRRTPDGGTEQEPAHWVRAARTVISAVRPAAAGIAALCLTGQMQDLVLEGERGPADPALHPAVLYTDLRAGEDAEQLRTALARAGTDWDELTGNQQDASSCAAMFRRLAHRSPEHLARMAGLVFGPAGHLAYVLGAGLHCDLTTAAATGLLEARTRRWSPAVARAAGIDGSLLPHLTGGSGEVVGHTGQDAQSLLDLPAGVPIVLAPGDAGAAAIGITGTRPGQDHASLGTSGWIASIRAVQGASRLPGADGASHRLALAEGTELRISAILAAGAAAAWARQAYLGGAEAAEADQLLVQRESERGRGPTGLLVLPSLGGERFPVRDGSLRGAVLGIDASTGPADLYAATLEGVALALSHALDPAAAGQLLPVVGGGAASAPWRRILADVTGRPVLKVDGTDATLLGAGIAGAEALGLEHGLDPLSARGGEVTPPDPEAAAAFAELRPAHRRLYESVAQY